MGGGGRGEGGSSRARAVFLAFPSSHDTAPPCPITTPAGSYVPTDKSYEKMGGNPHIVKLVPTTLSDIYAPAYYHLVWGSQLER